MWPLWSCCTGAPVGLSWRGSGFCCLGGWIFQTDCRCPSLPLHWGSTLFCGTESAERLPRTHLVRYTPMHLAAQTVLSFKNKQKKCTPLRNPSKATSLLAFVVSDISMYQWFSSPVCLFCIQHGVCHSQTEAGGQRRGLLCPAMELYRLWLHHHDCRLHGGSPTYTVYHGEEGNM